MRQTRPLLAIAILILITIFGVVLAWSIDEGRSDGTVARNVTIADQAVGGFDREQLAGAIDEIAQDYRQTSLVISSDNTFSVPAAAFDLELDTQRTLDLALEVRRTDNPVLRIGSWVKAFLVPTRAPVVTTYDPLALRQAVLRGEPGSSGALAEPSFEIVDNRLMGTTGHAGRGVDPAQVGMRLDDAARRGTPLRMRVEASDIPPRFSKADADSLAHEVEAQVLRNVSVAVGDTEGVLDGEFLRPAMRARAGISQLELDINVDELHAGVQRRFQSLERQPVQAQWDVVDGQPQVTNGQAGQRCCQRESTEALSELLIARINGEEPATEPLRLDLQTTPPRQTAESIPRLGINEEVGSFRTAFSPGQPRVTNIHRIADLVRGYVIEPGETFSLNRHVGPRTVEKGFVVDGVIQNGRFEESVGGGISQFATTLFNAAFFGGLDYGEYQAHTIYIERYPYGREATVSFGYPDLQIRNTTPHGVLIWPTYDATSITVSLYSTPFARGEQTGQSESPSGRCTRVETERTRTYTDGRSTRDSVVAIYQPEEGVTC